MLTNNWIVRAADNVFLRGGPYDPEPGQGEILVRLPDERMPDRDAERYDAASPTKRRPLTQAELDAKVDRELDRAMVVGEAIMKALIAGMPGIIQRINSGGTWGPVVQREIWDAIKADARARLKAQNGGA